jgi:hypothetical protein
MTSVPFTNNKPGFLRSWWVDAAMGGDATVGMVMPTGDIGAQYTAPGRAPDPAMVTVKFISADQSLNGQTATATAAITIVGGDYSGTISGAVPGAFNYTADASFTFIADDNQGQSIYEISGTVTVMNPVPIGPLSCTIDPASGPFLPNQTGDLVVNTAGFRDIPSNSYSLAWGFGWMATFSCDDGQGHISTFMAPVAGDFSTECLASPWVLITDPSDLHNSVACASVTFSWDLKKK